MSWREERGTGHHWSQNKTFLIKTFLNQIKTYQMMPYKLSRMQEYTNVIKLTQDGKASCLS